MENERPILRLNTRFRHGIDWPKRMSIVLSLASERKDDIQVVVSIVYEYVEKGKLATKGYQDSYLRWNAVRDEDLQLDLSSYRSKPWTVVKSGVLLHASAQMFDGGIKADLFVNGGLSCSSRMHYGSRIGNAGAGPSTGPNGSQRPFGSYSPGLGTSPQSISSAPMPKVAPQPKFSPQPKFTPQAKAAPQPEFTPQPKYTPQPKSGPAPKFGKGPDSFTWGPVAASGKGGRPKSRWARRDEELPAPGDSHISDSGHCTSFGRVEIGDKMHVVLYYNMTLYQAMNRRTDQDHMGSMRVWIGPD
jgi:hypothetical protein